MFGRIGRILLLGAALVLLIAPAGPARASNDPGFGRQWGLTQVGAPTAWARSTGAGVKVGIVDSGIDLNHEDLAGKIAAHTSCLDTNGNQASCSGSAQDDNGHGTHVSGIAGARKDNGKGVAGVAPDAQLVVAKVFQDTPRGYGAYVDDVIAGIKWAVDRGARVVNLSLGDDLQIISGTFGDDSYAEAVDYAWARGAVPVIAAGNGLFGVGVGSSNYGDANALVVGATGRNGTVAGYSSSLGNAKWGLVAPGGDGDCDGDDDRQVPDCVLSTYWEAGQSNRYGFLQGTSMAAPHVSGALADVFQANPGFSAQQAVDRILGTLAKTSCGTSCKGRLDIANAVGAGVTPPPVATAGGGGANGGANKGGATSAPQSQRPGSAPPRSGTPRAAAVAGVTAPTGEEPTTTTAPGTVPANDFSLGSDEVGGPEAAQPLRIRPDEDSDSSVPAGVGVLGAMGVLGAGGATAFVIRGRGGAAAVLEALRPGAGP